MGGIGLEERDGIEAKAVVLQQLRSALAIIQDHEPAPAPTVPVTRTAPPSVQSRSQRRVRRRRR
jgi:hypothetical protein